MKLLTLLVSTLLLIFKQILCQGYLQNDFIPFSQGENINSGNEVKNQQNEDSIKYNSSPQQRKTRSLRKQSTRPLNIGYTVYAVQPDSIENWIFEQLDYAISEIKKMIFIRSCSSKRNFYCNGDCNIYRFEDKNLYKSECLKINQNFDLHFTVFYDKNYNPMAPDALAYLCMVDQNSIPASGYIQVFEHQMLAEHQIFPGKLKQIILHEMLHGVGFISYYTQNLQYQKSEQTILVPSSIPFYGNAQQNIYFLVSPNVMKYISENQQQTRCISNGVPVEVVMKQGRVTFVHLSKILSPNKEIMLPGQNVHHIQITQLFVI